jgi:hypothetical protein
MAVWWPGLLGPGHRDDRRNHADQHTFDEHPSDALREGSRDR